MVALLEPRPTRGTRHEPRHDVAPCRHLGRHAIPQSRRSALGLRVGAGRPAFVAGEADQNEPQASGSLGGSCLKHGHAVRLPSHAVSHVDPTQATLLPWALHASKLWRQASLGMGGHSAAPARAPSCLLRSTKPWTTCLPCSPLGEWTTKLCDGHRHLSLRSPSATGLPDRTYGNMDALPITKPTRWTTRPPTRASCACPRRSHHLSARGVAHPSADVRRLARALCAASSNRAKKPSQEGRRTWLPPTC